MTDQPTYTQLLNRLKDIMLALRVSDLLDSDDPVWQTLRSVSKDMFNNPPIEGLEAEIEAEAQRVIAAAPDDWYWATWKADATNAPALETEIAELEKLVELEAELTEEQLSLIMQTWPWNLRDALGRWLGGACDRAGITSKRQRHALQYHLMRLFGEA